MQVMYRTPRTGRNFAMPVQILMVPCNGGQTHTVDLATGIVVWYHKGMPLIAIRWVLLRDPQEQFVPQGLLCTDAAIAPAQIIVRFVLY